MNSNDFKKLNARFEDRLTRFISSVTESDLTPEKRAERRDRCDANPMEFAKEYFGKLFELPFNAVHDWIADKKVGKFHAEASRYYGKSAFSYICIIIMPLVLGRDNGIRGIVNLNSLKLQIADFLAMGIVNSIKRNKKLLYDYEVRFDRDKTGYWIINGIPFLTGSYRTGLRSVHDEDMIRVTWQLNDDMYGFEEAASPDTCDKITNWIMDEAWGQLDQQVPVLSMTLGNAINERTPISQLAQKFPHNHFKLPACIDPVTREAREPEDGGISSWPEFRTTEEWIEFKNNCDPAVWSGQYQCEPMVHGNILQKEWLRPVNINTMKIVATMALCDPARGESLHACYKAFGVGSLTDKDQLIIRDLWIRRDSLWSLFDYAYKSKEVYGFNSFQWEDDFSQWLYAEREYRDWRSQTGKTLNIVPFLASDLATDNHSAQKFDRIMNTVLPFKRGEIMFEENVMKTRDYQELVKQYLAFKPDVAKKVRLDGLDMLASLFILIFRYRQIGSFRAVKKRIMQMKRVFR